MRFLFRGQKKGTRDNQGVEKSTPPTVTSTLEDNQVKAYNLKEPSGQDRPKTIGEPKALGYTTLPIREE